MSKEKDIIQEEDIPEATENAQAILQNASVLSDLSFQIKRETKNGEDYLKSLNSLIHQAGKDFFSLYQCVDSLLSIAKKLVFVSLQIVPTNDPNFKCLKTEAEKLLNALDNNAENDLLLETKYRNFDRLAKENVSCKSLITDEKYPEHCSRESLLEMSNIAQLPTVHEDVFTDFNRPSRTLSSSSLKNLRKVKMCLQRVFGEVDDNDAIEEEDSTVQQLPSDMDKVDCGTQNESVENFVVEVPVENMFPERSNK